MCSEYHARAKQWLREANAEKIADCSDFDFRQAITLDAQQKLHYHMELLAHLCTAWYTNVLVACAMWSTPFIR